MFKLLVTIVLLSGAQQYTHRDTFGTLQECEAAAARDVPILNDAIEEQVGAGHFALHWECARTSDPDGWGDDIARIFRDMGRRGGFGTVNAGN